MPVPQKNKAPVRSFCKRLVPTAIAQHIPHHPLPNKPLKECFSIVPEHVALHGGKQITGWTIWEFKRCWLEAEFHAVWQRPDGTIINLTPYETPGITRILFLPDPSRHYEGTTVHSILHPLTKDRSVLRWIALAREWAIEMDKLDLANDQTEFLLPPRMCNIKDEMGQLMEIIVETRT